MTGLSPSFLPHLKSPDEPQTMNKIASILLAGLLAIVMLGGFIALLGGSILGGLVFLIGIPFAFPITTGIFVLFFAVIIIRTVIEKRRERRAFPRTKNFE